MRSRNEYVNFGSFKAIFTGPVFTPERPLKTKLYLTLSYIQIQ